MGEVGGSVRRQQNFRLEAGLIERVEAAVKAGRAADKSAAVAVALERWLGGLEPPMVNMGSGATSGSVPLPADPERWSTVTSPADVGTLVAVADPGRFSPGDVVVVERTGERVRVREVDEEVLAVDRGFGAAIRNGGTPPSAAAIRLGDRVVVVERAGGDALEAPVVPDDLVASPAAVPAGEGGAAQETGEDGAATPAGPAISTASGVEGAGSAPSEGGQAGSGPVPAPPDIEAGGMVVLAEWLAEQLVKPVAVTRRWVHGGRVSVGGKPVPGEPAPFQVAELEAEGVELDGEPVLSVR